MCCGQYMALSSYKDECILVCEICGKIKRCESEVLTMKINDFKEAEKLINDYEQIKTDIKALSKNKKVLDIDLQTYEFGARVKTNILSTQYSNEEVNDAASMEIRNTLIKLLTVRKRKIETKLKEIGVEIPGLDEINIKVNFNFGLDVGK